MDRFLLFLAPESTDRAFRRIDEKLPRIEHRHFQSLQLLRAGNDLNGWSIPLEVDALATRSKAAVDLVGYSGGASMCLAFAAAHPERVRSLCLVEPPWIGNDIWSEAERIFVQSFDHLVTLDDLGCNKAFIELFAPGSKVPLPNGPEAMRRFAAALRTVWRGYRAMPLDRASLSLLRVPVLLPVGVQSSPRMMEQAAFLAKRVFHDARLLRIEGCHHFDILKTGAAAIAEALSQLLAAGEA